MIFDENGNPYDYRSLDVNPALTPDWLEA